jgi:tetratricopeptide (TPR) repeat protein
MRFALLLGIGYSASRLLGYSATAPFDSTLHGPAAQPSSDSARARALFEQGRAFFQARRFDDAATAFERAVELHPGRSEYHLWLGNAYTKQLATANFIRKGIIGRRIGPQYDKAVELDSTSVVAADTRVDFYLEAPGMAGGGVDKAKTEAARLTRLNAYVGGLAKARIAEKEKMSDQAEGEYRDLMRSFPDSARPVVALATLLQNRERFAEAFAVIDARLARFPNDTVMIYQLGRAAAISGAELTRGEAALHKFLALLGVSDPQSRANAHYRLGMIREKQGDVATARAQYDSAIVLNPRYDEAIAARKRLGR